MTAIEGRIRKVSTDVWASWVKQLKTGDEVVVADSFTNQAIHTATVKVTPTGRVYLEGQRDRTNWAKSHFLHIPGGGHRYIASREWLEG